MAIMPVKKTIKKVNSSTRRARLASRLRLRVVVMSLCFRCKSLNSECRLSRGSDRCASCVKVDHFNSDMFVSEQTCVFLFISS